mmetsp:Transcript_193/g.490  ORF Transcript_193/g.490 Transcript_193/m.490 type:complete len:241 (+) Transcript_193:179-901(+)
METVFPSVPFSRAHRPVRDSRRPCAFRERRPAGKTERSGRGSPTCASRFFFSHRAVRFGYLDDRISSNTGGLPSFSVSFSSSPPAATRYSYRSSRSGAMMADGTKTLYRGAIVPRPPPMPETTSSSRLRTSAGDVKRTTCSPVGDGCADAGSHTKGSSSRSGSVRKEQHGTFSLKNRWACSRTRRRCSLGWRTTTRVSARRLRRRRRSPPPSSLAAARDTMGSAPSSTSSNTPSSWWWWW